MVQRLVAVALAAAASLCASSSSFAQGNAQLQSLGGYSPGELKAAIAKSGDITIVKEAAFEGDIVWALTYEGINSALILNCPAENGGKCLAATLFTGYPTQISADAVSVNDLNRISRFGWLSSHGEGRVAFGHSMILSSATLDGFTLNIRLNAAAYVVRGQELLKAPKSVSLPGVAPPSRGETLVDANHLPAPAIGLVASLPEVFDDGVVAASLANALSDAQTYGEMRKIANQFLGE